MNLYEKLLKREEKLSLVGLGYVGMPIAVAFAEHVDVVGFDLNAKKIELYKQGIDPTHEIGDEGIAACKVDFTADETRLKEAKFHIVAVPTPVRADHTPDLTPVEGASTIVGRNLVKGSIVVYESTVYPGVTEEICVPILEKESGLKCGVDFKVAYSPERINPGDKEHRLENIVKIVSGMDDETLAVVADVYRLVVKVGVHCAPSIKVAEAAKVIENSQRDINIAFMNELSVIFNKMGIDTKAVLEAAGTKWNFLKFFPGLVGGHCIGVDPYYLPYRAEQLGYHSQVILAGRRINDDMGKYVAENTIKCILKTGAAVKGAKVAILGFTFKEIVLIQETPVLSTFTTSCRNMVLHLLLQTPLLMQMKLSTNTALILLTSTLSPIVMLSFLPLHMRNSSPSPPMHSKSSSPTRIARCLLM